MLTLLISRLGFPSATATARSGHCLALRNDVDVAAPDPRQRGLRLRSLRMAAVRWKPDHGVQ
jgi:hypothetical protein